MSDEFSPEVRAGAKAACAQYLELIEPARPDLARYCRRLTGSLWDAEDLAQDTLVRGFGLLGSMPDKVSNPRAYLLRVATHIWIDARRRQEVEAAILSDAALSSAETSAPTQEGLAQVRDAGAMLLRYLAPQERAAILLKDVLDMSVEETATILGTTSGAVKAALHRGRGRLKDIERQQTRPMPDARVVDAFVQRYNARDLQGLLSLMLDSGSVEMPPIVTEFGREAFERERGWFQHSVATGELPRMRLMRVEFLGESIVIQLHTLWGQEVLTSVTRLETLDGKISRLRSYTFCPDVVREVAETLGYPVGPLFYSLRKFFASWQTMPAEALR